jgi:hypothetical protein
MSLSSNRWSSSLSFSYILAGSRTTSLPTAGTWSCSTSGSCNIATRSSTHKAANKWILQLDLFCMLNKFLIRQPSPNYECVGGHFIMMHHDCELSLEEKKFPLNKYFIRGRCCGPLPQYTPWLWIVHTHDLKSWPESDVTIVGIARWMLLMIPA